MLTHLTTHLALDQPGQVGVRPLALGPRLHVLEVVGEIHRLQLVVNKLANVPWQIVVTGMTTSGLKRIFKNHQNLAPLHFRHENFILLFLFIKESRAWLGSRSPTMRLFAFEILESSTL